MRILVVTDQWSPDVVGGSARVAADTARALAKRGHEVVVVAPRRETLPAVEYDGGVELHRVIRRSSLPQTISDPIETRRAMRRLDLGGFDVGVSHQATNGAALTGVGLPHVAIFHASAVLELRYLRARVRRTRRAALIALAPLLVALERRWLHAADGILVLSRFSEQLLTGRYPDLQPRVRVVRGGVSPSLLDTPSERPADVRARLGTGGRTLLFTARRLEPRMGVDLLVDAIGLLADANVQLIVAGDGPDRRRLEERVRTKGLQDRIRLLGRVTESELAALYAASDLFVMPSVAFEGFGLSTVEALGHGTPVLGTAVGATPEILEQLGDEFVVRSTDASALAAGIGRVLPLLGPELRARARALGRDVYGWETAIGPWEEELTRVARR